MTYIIDSKKDVDEAQSLSVQAKGYPLKYLEGIDLFNAQRYYEAHEAWEDIWRPATGATKLFYQGLIQAAAALLHYDRQNGRGAKLCIDNALKKLESLDSPYMSLNLLEFTATLRTFLAAVINEQPQIIYQVASPHPLIVLLSDPQRDKIS